MASSCGIPRRLNSLDETPRKIDRKGEIVLRIDEERLLVPDAIEIDLRADRQPHLAKSIEIDGTFQSGPHVRRRQTAPDDIGEVRRDVIERLSTDQRLMCSRQQRET